MATQRQLADAEARVMAAARALQRQCERCAAQWTLHPRYGWALSPHTLFGCAT